MRVACCPMARVVFDAFVEKLVMVFCGETGVGAVGLTPPPPPQAEQRTATVIRRVWEPIKRFPTLSTIPFEARILPLLATGRVEVA